MKGLLYWSWKVAVLNERVAVLNERVAVLKAKGCCTVCGGSLNLKIAVEGKGPLPSTAILRLNLLLALASGCCDERLFLFNRMQGVIHLAH